MAYRRRYSRRRRPVRRGSGRRIRRVRPGRGGWRM